MILTPSIFTWKSLAMSGTPPELMEELLIETLSEISKMVGVMFGVDFLASSIWFAKCKMWGHSTSHVQISNVFVKFSSCSRTFLGSGGGGDGGDGDDGGNDGAFLLDKLTNLSFSTFSLSKYIISIN